MIDIDYVKLNTYQSEWQFRVNMKRQSANDPSPKLNKLSFFVSDSKSENNINYNELINDNPGFVYHDTEHIYQYSVDPDIGPDICSPSSTTMALRSFFDTSDQPFIEIDELVFARDNYDTFHGLFGVWPRAVQNASEYRSADGQYRIDGAVTRYRTWSAAYKVLKNGGRIVMSVGPPLYSRHLMMLAGFMEDGRVIVHDPAKPNSSGYQRIYDKYKLSQSWFNKGGISYTFYLVDDNDNDAIPSVFDNCPNIYNPEQEDSDVDGLGNACDSTLLSIKVNDELIDNFDIFQNYPNPFNSRTNISFNLSETSEISISVFNITGQLVDTILTGQFIIGNHNIYWNAENIPSGTYYIQLSVGNHQQIIKSVILK
jgi:hypothetical protein